MIVLNAIALFDDGFGPRILPVTAPGGDISPSSDLAPKSMGKAPGRLTGAGWTGVSVNDLAQRCPDFKTARLWQDTWHANVGLVAGDGYLFIDNDQGEAFSHAFTQALLANGATAWRRFVQDPKHKRDAFLLRVLDFLGDPAEVKNHTFKFRKGTATTKVQILARSLQAVVAGTHPDTKSPYVWEAFGDLADVPTVSDKKFYEIISSFVELTSADGWTLVSVPLVPGPAAGAKASGNAIAPPSPSLPPPGDAVTQAALARIQVLLDWLVNRIVPPGESPTKVDEWLDDYTNWTSVAYRIAAQLGRPIASTPQAEQLWVSWSNGRPQRQDPRTVWHSVLNQPTWQFGSVALTKLVDELGARPKPGFPDVDPNDPAIQPLPTPTLDRLSDWALLTSKSRGAFMNTGSGEVLSFQSFNARFADLAKLLASELRPGLRKTARVPSVSDLLSEHPGKRVVGKVTYAPGEPPLAPWSEDPGTQVFNRWRATFAQACAVSLQSIKPWLDHVELIMEDETERFLRWCAYAAQFPGEKANWHYLIMSDQGLGKDLMLVPLQTAVGEHNCNAAGIGRLARPHTNVFEAKLVVISETSQFRHGEAVTTFNNTLKEALANPPATLSVNPKNMDEHDIKNLCAVVLLSNDLNPAYLEPSDRRVNVVNRRHLKPQAPVYYQTLDAWLAAGGKDLCASYLLSLPLSAADRLEFKGRAPGNDDKDALIALNKPVVLSTLEDLIRDGCDGLGPFSNLLATVDQIVDQIAMRVPRRPGASEVKSWLLDMERRGAGVGRLRRDPKHPNGCGRVGYGGQAGARLWHLGEKAPGGQDWSTFSNTELLAMWEHKPLPRKAKVMPFPSTTTDVPGDPPKADGNEAGNEAEDEAI